MNENPKTPLSIEEIRIKDQARDSTIITLGILFIFGGTLIGLFIGDLFFNKNILQKR